MTTELITFKFHTLTGADELLEHFKTLRNENFVEMRDAVVITKTDQAHVDVRQPFGNKPGRGTAAGALTGTLLGIPAGPAGAAVGLVTGALAGRAADAAHEPGHLDEEFRSLARVELQPGESMLLVYAESIWVIPIEVYARQADAAVFHRSNVAWPGDQHPEGVYIRRQTLDARYETWQEALQRQRAEIDTLRQRAVQNLQAERASIQQKLDQANAKLEERYQHMLNTLAVWREQVNGTISQLEAEIKQAPAQAKAEIEQRLAAARERRAALEAKTRETFAAWRDDIKADFESIRYETTLARKEHEKKLNERIAHFEQALVEEERRLAARDKAQIEAWETFSQNLHQDIESYRAAMREAEREYKARE
jgi:uncharacterized membrane protein